MRDDLTPTAEDMALDLPALLELAGTVQLPWDRLRLGDGHPSYTGQNNEWPALWSYGEPQSKANVTYAQAAANAAPALMRRLLAAEAERDRLRAEVERLRSEAK